MCNPDCPNPAPSEGETLVALNELKTLITSKKTDWRVLLLPGIITAIFAGLASYFGVLKTLGGTEEANRLKQLEILNTIIKEFNPDYPERTIIMVELAQEAIPSTSDTAAKIHKYALTLANKKVEKAENLGGAAGAEKIKEVVDVISQSTSKEVQNAEKAIVSGTYHVIVASATTKASAMKLLNDLKKTGFAQSMVIRTGSNFYAVSLGTYSYQSGLEQVRKYTGLPRYSNVYANQAYLQKMNKNWIIDSQ
jgi:hypothetical protein